MIRMSSFLYIAAAAMMPVPSSANGQDQTVPAPDGPEAAKRKVCSSSQSTGSIVAKRSCKMMTEAEIAAAKDQRRAEQRADDRRMAADLELLRRDN